MPDISPAKPIDCLIILGMHRSGTSVLTGCLNLLGVKLGTSLMPANAANLSGYWENNDLVAVHDILLRDLGCTWNIVGALPAGWLESEAANRAANAIRRLVQKHYLDKGIWAIKDPRMCRLMPLWLPILEELGCRPGFVVSIRHPLEVARSLARRDKFTLRKSLLLWLVHNRDIFAACQGRACSVLTYDQLLADPLHTLCNLGQDLGLAFPVAPAQALPTMLNFVQPGLKTQHTDEQTDDDQRLCVPFVRLYDQFRTACLRDRRTICFDSAFASGHSDHEQPLTFQYVALQQTGAFTPHDVWGQIFSELLIFTGDQERKLHSQTAQKEQHLLGRAATDRAFMAQVFFPQTDKPVYAEARTRSFVLSPDQWQEIVCEIPDPQHLSGNGLRFDPMNTPGSAVIQSFRLTNKATGQHLIQADKPEDFHLFQAARHAMVVSTSEAFTVLSIGHDPQLLLPPIPNTPDGPLELRVWLRVSANQEILRQEWERMGATLKSQEHAEKMLREEVQALETSLSDRDALLAHTRETLVGEQAKGQELRQHVLELQATLALQEGDLARVREATSIAIPGLAGGGAR